MQKDSAKAHPNPLNKLVACVICQETKVISEVFLQWMLCVNSTSMAIADMKSFVLFPHEDRKCEDKFCDIRLCSLRHPKNCKYVVKNKPCKFGEFCSCEHEIDDIATFLRDTPEKIIQYVSLEMSKTKTTV